MEIRLLPVFKKPSRYLHQRTIFHAAAGVLGMAYVAGLPAIAADMPNACPVDGCIVTILSAEKQDAEIAVKLEANFTPDNARNHLHMWWGEQFTVQQVGRNAMSEHSVEQGKWHRHDDYPLYITTGAASVAVRDGSTTLCVTAADRGHNVLDADKYHCIDISSYL